MQQTQPPSNIPVSDISVSDIPAADILIFAESGQALQKARALSESLKLPLAPDAEAAAAFCAGGGLLLKQTADGLCLQSGPLTLLPDFSALLPRIASGKLPHEYLVRSARHKVKDRLPEAIDATAGLGEDALILAAAGYRVQLFERNPVIAALLADCLERALRLSALAPIVSRMQLHPGDSLPYLQSLLPAQAPDLIFLDPMFPERRKGALIQKKLQLLQKLELPCAEENALLEAALALRPHRLVIKRPLKGPFLAGKKPHYSLRGKAIRYDCFVFA